LLLEEAKGLDLGVQIEGFFGRVQLRLRKGRRPLARDRRALRGGRAADTNDGVPACAPSIPLPAQLGLVQAIKGNFLVEVETALLEIEALFEQEVVFLGGLETLGRKLVAFGAEEDVKKGADLGRFGERVVQ
jgi:hypothetical protein